MITDTIEILELLKPRYKVIGDYPNNELPLGLIVTNIHDNVWSDGKNYEFTEDESWFKKYPHLFRKLAWYDERTLSELMDINYVRITIYTGYWVVGDVIKVTDYKIDTKAKKLERYIFDSHSTIPMRCEPATEKEYIDFKIKAKIS